MPFSGKFKEIDIMENKALFRRTTHKESSQGSVLNPKRGSYINILDSSWESQFQFFTHSNIKPERSTIDVFDNQWSSRAKTPILENYNSQVTDGEWKLSPQGILKKPQTAKIGMRKQVHYNNIEIRQNSSNWNNAIRSPKIENILESSYFRS